MTFDKQQLSRIIPSYEQMFHRARKREMRLWEQELNARLDLSASIRKELQEIDRRWQELSGQLHENETKIARLEEKLQERY